MKRRRSYIRAAEFREIVMHCSVPLVMSIAATIATCRKADRDALVAAWVSVAVVGTASVISGVVALRHASSRNGGLESGR